MAVPAALKRSWDTIGFMIGVLLVAIPVMLIVNAGLSRVGAPTSGQALGVPQH